MKLAIPGDDQGEILRLQHAATCPCVLQRICSDLLHRWTVLVVLSLGPCGRPGSDRRIVRSSFISRSRNSICLVPHPLARIGTPVYLLPPPGLALADALSIRCSEREAHSKPLGQILFRSTGRSPARCCEAGVIVCVYRW